MDTQGGNYTRAVKADCLWIIRMWMAGMSARAIAERMGISVRTVHRRIRRLQTDGIVTLRPYPRGLTNFLSRNNNVIKNSALFSYHNFHYGSFYLYTSMRTEVWP
ncbi:hypothetical protein Pmani_015647 [Petrolisthes manimaculis]|uniref:Insertion element IS150 protein InsJ-like helix-turn-helix domain-containing protein n=1 Tax=Petrolisthes manimaculis TaxID=1843537 RepID=A0AAE1PU13_9EUCA|nr:hypothetical protein Pmani_015647 [Petrolisthes manimaculis]